MKRYQSWGRFPQAEPCCVKPVFWRDESPDLSALQRPVLPYAYGRSYGDSCLNADGTLLDVSNLRRFISFDAEKGVLRCEAGVSLAEILNLIVLKGWFLPVVPGTKFVSVGGAIANDIHGKNHHVAGTFGSHVRRFKLVRSNGDRLICSPTENAEFYRATIGGLGLTGLITWAEIQLKRIPSPFIEIEQIRFSNVDEFFEIASESDQSHEYTVAWLDCLAGGDHLGRGLFIRGNHYECEPWSRRFKRRKWAIRVPFDAPSFILNTSTVKAFNTVVYYRSAFARRTRRITSYDPFFFPLDTILDWNRLYGKNGFLQYQCVVPIHDYRAIKEILTRISRSGVQPFLNVFKKFGDVPSPGMLSFPRPGVTLALDFPYRGQKTLCLLETLDEIVRSSGGAVYPAKDARMSPESFDTYFPNWQAFSQYVDPKFSSSFWRRVTGGKSA
jgi:FAD/FMN-containing dehydrogenase